MLRLFDSNLLCHLFRLLDFILLQRGMTDSNFFSSNTVETSEPEEEVSKGTIQSGEICGYILVSSKN